MLYIMEQALRFALTVALVGIAAHFLGEALPRRWFDASRFPYRAFAFERNGRFYEALGIRRWKGLLPDKSRFAPGAYKKSIRAGQQTSAHMERLLQETCVAEMVHLILMLLSPIIYWINPTGLGAAIAIVYALSHVPFIIIQRYNRPTLVTLSKRLKEREERIKHAHTDPVR